MARATSAFLLTCLVVTLLCTIPYAHGGNDSSQYTKHVDDTGIDNEYGASSPSTERTPHGRRLQQIPINVPDSKTVTVSKDACLNAYPPTNLEEASGENGDDEDGNDEDLESGSEEQDINTDPLDDDDKPSRVILVKEIQEAAAPSGHGSIDPAPLALQGKKIGMLYLIPAWQPPRAIEHEKPLFKAVEAVVEDIHLSKRARGTRVLVMNHDGAANPQYEVVREYGIKNETWSKYTIFVTSQRDKNEDPPARGVTAAQIQQTRDLAYMLDFAYQRSKYAAILNFDSYLCPGATDYLANTMKELKAMRWSAFRFGPVLGGIMLKGDDLQLLSSYLEIAVFTKPAAGLVSEYIVTNNQELLVFLHLFNTGVTAHKSWVWQPTERTGFKAVYCGAEMDRMAQVLQPERPVPSHCPRNTYSPCNNPPPRRRIPGVTSASGPVRAASYANAQHVPAGKPPGTGDWRTDPMAPRPNMLTDAERKANRGMPELAKPVSYDGASVPNARMMIGKTDQSCEVICNAWKMDCLPSDFHLLNKCTLLAASFRCDKCTSSYGKDQPAMDPSGAGKCLFHEDISNPQVAPSCSAHHPKTRRICPCSPRGGAEQVTEDSGVHHEYSDSSAHHAMDSSNESRRRRSSSSSSSSSSSGDIGSQEVWGSSSGEHRDPLQSSDADHIGVGVSDIEHHGLEESPDLVATPVPAA